MAKGGFSKAEGGKKSKQFAVAGWKGEGAKQGEDCIEGEKPYKNQKKTLEKP